MFRVHCGSGGSALMFWTPVCAALCCLYGVFPSVFGCGTGARQNNCLHVCLGFISCVVCNVDVCGLCLLAWACCGIPSAFMSPAVRAFTWFALLRASAVFSVCDDNGAVCSCSSCMLDASRVRRPRHVNRDQALCLLSYGLGFGVIASVVLLRRAFG